MPSSMVALACLSLLILIAGAEGNGVFEDVRTMAFTEGYTQLFGDGNLRLADGDRKVHLTLDRFTGSGFVSSSYYYHGFFTAYIKLPKDHTAGVVVAFYLSNGDVFETNHDELDFEFLGNRKGHEWRLQTNVYGSGSTDRGREERYLFPFDPTERPHRYSIVWTENVVIFYVDDTPIREVVRAPGMALDYPSKPMALYATIWDGSSWATDNGKYKVNYKRGQFTADFSGLAIQGCAVDPTTPTVMATNRCTASELEISAAEYTNMTPEKRAVMRQFRGKYMTYTVCYDILRYSPMLPECKTDPEERGTFTDWGESKVVKAKVRRLRRRRPAKVAAAAAAATKVGSQVWMD